MSDVTIFAPSPILTITVEDHPSGDEIHVHAEEVAAEAALNVNAPNTASSERDEHHIRLAVEDLPHAPEPGTDAGQLADGWVTVTGLESVTGVPLGLR